MACSRARRLSPVLALLVAAAAALANPQSLGRIEPPGASDAAVLGALSPAVEAVLPFKLEQPADRAGHSGTKHRMPPALAVLALGLPALAAALRANRRPRVPVLQPPWFTTPPSRGPPLLPLVAT